MGKIYTKKGDKGETATCLGKISKSDELVEALGTIDELNSWIGYCRSQYSVLSTQYSKIFNELIRIQTNLMTINSILAGTNKIFNNYETKHLENIIDKLQKDLPELKNFIYPMGELQFARTLARRAERRVVYLNNQYPITNNQTNSKLQITNYKQILKYLNRLSDALFVIARFVNFQIGVKEEVWK